MAGMDDEGRARPGRPAGSSGAGTLKAIRAEGARMLRERGYGATSLRDLAARVGIKAGSLYNHIAGKQQLLFLLVEGHTRLALEGLDAALAEAGDDPVARLRAFVAFHVAFHTARPEEAAVCLSELRNLEGANREAVLALRRAYEGRLVGVVRDGAEAGVFRAGDPRLAALAVLGMVTGVLGWYRPDGRLRPEAIAGAYADLLLDGLRPRGQEANEC